MRWIDKCLGSLMTSTHPLHVIVIDNLSEDETAKYIKLNFPGIMLIEAGANLGFGQANNIGLRRALQENADYVFLLNQDTWIQQNTIDELLKAATENPDFGIVSPFHLDASEANLERLFLDLFDRYNSALIPDMFFKKLQAIYETGYIHAASWFLSRKCVITTGGFDPLFFHYGEDDDYLQRAKYFTFKAGLVPTAFIVHDAYYNTWEKVEWNENRNLVIAYQQLKKMSSSFRSNVLAFFKTGFDELTTLLLFRKFKKFRFRFKVLWKAILQIKKVQKSYKSSFAKGAFLKYSDG